MNNKDTAITLKIPKIYWLSPRPQGQRPARYFYNTLPLASLPKHLNMGLKECWFLLYPPGPVFPVGPLPSGSTCSQPHRSQTLQPIIGAQAYPSKQSNINTGNTYMITGGLVFCISSLVSFSFLFPWNTK